METEEDSTNLETKGLVANEKEDEEKEIHGWNSWRILKIVA